ncbi:nuclear transcription factor Y subunit B-4-like [Solanum tuberosum]|uniref:Leafy cotyledon1 n=2 Tax=Solanum tuberosum TaxID=4113 RepID=M1B1V0_SOLTU|nr:PREDICTED: nuclear transcription factor Y subunit B-4-like [Solanum tuberosum]XP_015168329.1 PREDICTED: nuclear transcription factor Y subunit B-4-like [Solanum tuberosum]XP_015168330.1 PREDICTED: nuclear transcription factor Y subunit B-4-like [Solanum tuberosum]XP_015168331.1 PREDICTED: nuclear transcription factor Y subunit B-4-like [Solanum tuberosum]
MDNGNHVGGSGNGGFHSYRRSPQPNPAHSPSSDMEMILELPSHLNQAVVEGIIQEQDQFMPNVARIMHRTFPPHIKISDDAKWTMHDCISEFICFVTYEANARCQREQRNTITDEDVHWVTSKFGFDDYIEPLPLYLPRYHEDDGGECGSLIGESLLKRPMVDTASNCNITPYHQPPNFPMAHHHLGYPPPMGNGDMQGDASNGSTSQCAMDNDVEFPSEGGKE